MQINLITREQMFRGDREPLSLWSFVVNLMEKQTIPLAKSFIDNGKPYYLVTWIFKGSTSSLNFNRQNFSQFYIRIMNISFESGAESHSHPPPFFFYFNHLMKVSEGPLSSLILYRSFHVNSPRGREQTTLSGQNFQVNTEKTFVIFVMC